MRFFFDRRALFAAFCILCCFAASFVAGLGNKYRENVLDLIPFRDSVLSDYYNAADKFSQTKMVFFNVSGADAEKAAEALEASFSKSGILEVWSARNIDFANVMREILAYVPSVFDSAAEKKLDEITGEKSVQKRLEFFSKKMSAFESAAYKQILICDTLGISEIFFDKLKAARNFKNFGETGRICDGSGTNFLVVGEGGFESSDSAKSARLIKEIDGEISAVLEKFPDAKIAYGGAYTIAKENAEIARRDSAVCVSMTVVLMSIICLFAFRRRRYALFALLPSLAGTSVAFVVFSLIFPEISRVSVAFASIAIGVSIDYAIHILHALDSAPDIFPRRLLKPIAAAVLTTMSAFCIMCVFGGRGFLQMGVFGGLSVAFSALLSLWLLPKLARSNAKVPNRAALFERLSDTLWNFKVRHSKILRIAALISIGFAAYFASGLTFEGNVSNLSALGEKARADASVIKKIWGGAISGKKVVISAGSFEALSQKLDEISGYLNGLNLQVSDIGKLLPTTAAAEKNIERWKRYWSPEKIVSVKENIYKAAKKFGMNANMLAKNIPDGGVSGFKMSADNALAKTFLKGMLEQRGGDCTLAIGLDVKDGADRYSLYKNLKKNFPDAAYVDMDFFGDHISGATKNWLLRFACVAAVCVAVCLFAIFGSGAFKIVFPVALGLLWSFAAFAILGVGINIVSAIFVIFAVCMAQDYSIFLASSSKDIASGGSRLEPVLISAATTICAFGTFAFARHPVLNSLGLAAAVSITFILLASVIFADNSNGGNGK